jgi:hypothetical protein
VPGGDRIERIPDMQARDGSRRPLQFTLAAAGESDHRAMETLLDTCRQDTDDALVPLRVKQTESGRQFLRIQSQRLDGSQRLRLHAGLDVLAVAVERIEPNRHGTRAGVAVRQQAFDAERHVFQASGRIQARPDDKAEIGRDDTPRRSAGDLQQRPYTRYAAPGADALQALLDEYPVIAVERHHRPPSPARPGPGTVPDSVPEGPAANQPRARKPARSASMT